MANSDTYGPQTQDDKHADEAWTMTSDQEHISWTVDNELWKSQNSLLFFMQVHNIQHNIFLRN